jgi:DNA-binding transcriptional ArsR family regulator
MQNQTALPPPTADQIFFALGDASRRSIFQLVTSGPQTVSALAGALGVTLTAVAQHLVVLESSGLLRTRKQGRVRICEMHGEGLNVLAQWVALNRKMWEQRFDALDALLGEEPSPTKPAG